MERPALVNGRCAVMRGQVQRANGGLYYSNRDEFVACLQLLLADGSLRASMGRNGRDYVRRNYRWETVLGKYERVLAKVRNAR